MPLWAIALGGASRSETAVTMYQVSEQGIGRAVGRIAIVESERGLVFTPSLSGLSALSGEYGFQIHERGDCGSRGDNGETGPALAAGKHHPPYGSGAGDLPRLSVDERGRVSRPVLAPRLQTLSGLRGRALVVHAANDSPAGLMGESRRVLCGVIR